jgi:signal transduction histidine kinase
MSGVSWVGGRIGHRAGRAFGPRPGVLVGCALLVLGLLSAFAYVLIDSQGQSRREAQKSFAAEARITSQLTSSLFTASASATQAAAVKAFGGPTPSQDALAAFVKRSHLAYALILASDGEVLAASPGAPVAARKGAAASSHVRAALGGRSWLSGVLPGRGGVGHVIELALPFETAHGRRVEVEGLDADGLSQFLRGYLDQPGNGDIRAGYVVDEHDNLIASSGRTGKIGDHLPGALAGIANGRYRSGGVDRYVVSAPLEGSSWRVLLSEPTSALYPALAGSRSWILFAVLGAFGLAGAASVAFLRGALVSNERLGETNRQLADVNATLEERVAERTAVAEERTRELARSNAELEQFASVASHDLQEPLRKIRMYCERLPRRLGDDLSADAASDLERMQNAAERMQRLIDDLLTFARVTSKKREFELVDLGEVTGEVIGDLEARVSELGARIDVVDLPVVAADRLQISQLLQNLVSNALKFHRADVPPVVRIRGTVVAAQQPLSNGDAPAPPSCVITVEDNGVGFEQKYAERIFSAFERLHSRSDYEGTGIGLSIARKIAWRHRGEITATSTPGQGSTFTLTLPLPSGNGATPKQSDAQ